MLRPMPSGAKDPPRCLIVDDHPVVAGVRSVLLDAFGGARVLDAASVDEALEVLGGDPPDVVIVDPWKVDPDIIDVVGRLATEVGAPIVVFTSDGGARLLAEALKAGVKGYVRRTPPPMT